MYDRENGFPGSFEEVVEDASVKRGDDENEGEQAIQAHSGVRSLSIACPSNDEKSMA
jgi:hypothetical protein